MTTSSGAAEDFKGTSEQLDALFAALADEQRRQVVRYFQTKEDDVVSVEDLVEYVVKDEDVNRTREQIEQTLHHVTLPKLADQRVIEYDARSRAVKYCGSQALERVLTVVTKSDQDVN